MRFLKGSLLGLFFVLGLSVRSPFVALAEGIPEPPLVLYGRVLNVVGSESNRVVSGSLIWVFRSSDGSASVTNTTQLTDINGQFSYVLQVPCESAAAGFLVSPDVLTLSNPTRIYIRTNVTLTTETVISAPLRFQGTGMETFVFSPDYRGALQRIDFVMSQADGDNDGDGLPDWWECRYFACNSAPDSDPDHDGVTNTQEFRAGTDPTNSASALAFLNVEVDATGSFSVEWSSVSNKVYTLLRAKVLSTNEADYSVVQAGIKANIVGGNLYGTNVFRDAFAPDAGHFFYRIRLEEAR